MTEPTTVVIHRPSQTVKILLAITACLLSVSLIASIFYLAPTVRNLSEDTALEKAQDACYDQFSDDVTDGIADTLAALAVGNGAIGNLVVALAAQPRDMGQVESAVEQVGASAREAITASQRYGAAIKARQDYVASGRPVPCTNLPN